MGSRRGGGGGYYPEEEADDVLVQSDIRSQLHWIRLQVIGSVIYKLRFHFGPCTTPGFDRMLNKLYITSMSVSMSMSMASHVPQHVPTATTDAEGLITL